MKTPASDLRQPPLTFFLSDSLPALSSLLAEGTQNCAFASPRRLPTRGPPQLRVESSPRCMGMVRTCSWTLLGPSPKMEKEPERERGEGSPVSPKLGNQAQGQEADGFWGERDGLLWGWRRAREVGGERRPPGRGQGGFRRGLANAGPWAKSSSPSTFAKNIIMCQQSRAVATETIRPAKPEILTLLQKTFASL